jgi:hypothetical protein
MDTQSPNLATRLRHANVDKRVAVLVAAALEAELGVEGLRDHDLAGAQRLTALIEAAARRAGSSAVCKAVFEVLELLGEDPELRAKLTRPPETVRA